MFTIGNPWNCTTNLKWLLQTKGEQVADRDEMWCDDIKYHGRPLMAVMQFKMVCFMLEFIKDDRLLKFKLLL